MRQLNNFSGSNLALAPPDLLFIPATNTTTVTTPPIVHMTAEQEKESKVKCFLMAVRRKQTKNKECSTFHRSEAIASLEMNDYNVEKAVEEATGDCEWETKGSA